MSKRFDSNWTAKVTVPVKRVGASWEFFYGGDVPVKQGTLGELTIDANAITDEGFQQRVSKETTINILPEGTRLLVALNDKTEAALDKKTPWPQIYPQFAPLGVTRFEAVTIGPSRLPLKLQKPPAPIVEGGLRLRLKGLGKTELVCSTIFMPTGFKPSTANSPNHAYSLLSTVYETHRTSNTGNAYERFFYQESDGYWYPLDELRQGVQASTERTLISDAWAELENLLGWRPLSSGARGTNEN